MLRITAEKAGIWRQPDDRAMRYKVPGLGEAQTTLRDAAFLSKKVLYNQSNDRTLNKTVKRDELAQS